MDTPAPNAHEIAQALQDYMSVGATHFAEGRQMQGRLKIKKYMFTTEDARKIPEALWLLDAIHRMEGGGSFPKKIERILAASPRHLDTQKLRHELHLILMGVASVDTLRPEANFRALWGVMKANPKSIGSFALARHDELDGFYKNTVRGYECTLAINDTAENIECFLAASLLAMPDHTETSRRYDAPWAGDECYHLTAIFSTDHDEKARRGLLANLLLIQKNAPRALDVLALSYARYLVHRLAQGPVLIDPKISGLLFDDSRIEVAYMTLTGLLSPKRTSWSEAYPHTLAHAAQLLRDILSSVKCPKQDELLTTWVGRALQKERGSEYSESTNHHYFRWVAGLAQNWPACASALMNLGMGASSGFKNPEKASSSTVCRQAMTYLICGFNVTTAPLNSLAKVVLEDHYSIKHAGLVLHNRSNRNKAIEVLYQVTGDDKLLALMNGSSLEVSLASDLGL